MMGLVAKPTASRHRAAFLLRIAARKHIPSEFPLVSLSRATGCFALPREQIMTRDELTETVRRNLSDTLIALRLREALGLPRSAHRVDAREVKKRKYRGARKLMKQRHGVRL